MNGLALCAGIGGIELGLRLALGDRYRCVCHVEREAYAAATLVARMEDEALDRAPVWDDLASFDGKPWRGVVDLVSAGFPCQPFSAAGKRRGIEDERWIWPAIAGIVRDVRPGYVFVENVPGLALHGLDAVLASLAELGFDAQWDVFSARGVGAPHIRRRLFVLAYRDSSGRSEDTRGAPCDEGENAWRKEAYNHELDGARESLADRDGHGCSGFGSGGVLDRERAALRDDADRRHADLADTPTPQRREISTGRDKHNGHDAGWQEADGGLTAGGEVVGNTDSEGLQGWSQPFGEGADELPAWPPGPADADGWKAYLAAGGPEPAVRRDADGTACRMERLRCLGNSVVPLVAARAFLALAARAGLVTEKKTA